MHAQAGSHESVHAQHTATFHMAGKRFRKTRTYQSRCPDSAQYCLQRASIMLTWPTSCRSGRQLASMWARYLCGGDSIHFAGSLKDLGAPAFNNLSLLASEPALDRLESKFTCFHLGLVGAFSYHLQHLTCKKQQSCRDSTPLGRCSFTKKAGG